MTRCKKIRVSLVLEMNEGGGITRAIAASTEIWGSSSDDPFSHFFPLPFRLHFRRL